MKSLYLVCFSLLMLTACKKEIAPVVNPAGKTKTQLLTQKNWIISKVEVDGVDKTSTAYPCILDNVITFLTGGTGYVDEGSTKCNSADPQQKTFTWVFQNNETELNLAGDGMTGLPTVTQLDENTMKHSIVFGGSTIVNTYVHP
ncbi:hypothetical protein BH09BAC2_BH09BAC2_13330 [soil metagenome]